MPDELNIWGILIPADQFSAEELDYLMPLVELPLPSVEWVWNEMDRVWNDYHLDNMKPLAEQNIELFYSHPVWILNSIFSMADSESRRHRNSIANWISARGAKRIADYGGGGGVLAGNISALSPYASIDIIEPFPSAWGQQKVTGIDNVNYINELEGPYDLIVAQDVLEHLEQPMDAAEKIAEALTPNGLAIFANSFYPHIQCHLPGTFHLRYTFRFILWLGGLSYMGKVEGVEHADIFRKAENWRGFGSGVMIAERLCVVPGRVINLAVEGLRGVKRSLRFGRDDKRGRDDG